CNYKKIREVNLDFNNINIIIGKNNSGKSSLLSAIHFFFTIIYSIKDNINNRGNIAKIKRDNPEKISYIFKEENLIYNPTDNISSIAYDKLPKRTDLKSGKKGIEFIFNNNIKIVISEYNNVSYSFDLFYLINSFDKGEELYNVIKEFTNYFGDIYSIYCPGISGIIYNEPYKNKIKIIKDAFNFDAANTVLKNILLGISKEKDILNNFNKDFKFLFGDEYELEFPKENAVDINEYIQINVKIENKTIPIHQMGIGFLQLLHILSYKHYFKSKILILDEPEMHLHAKLCHKLLDLLENWSKDYNMQIFISTHSYNSIKYITNKSNKNEYNLYHSKYGSINKCEISEVEDIFFNDIGELPAIKENCDYFIITEDEKPLIEKLIPNEYHEKIQVMPSRKSDICRIYQEIIKISKKCFIIFHVDLDRYEEYEATLKSKNIPINGNIILWHTDYATIEGYWLIYDNLKSLIKSMKKDEEGTTIDENLNKIILNNKEEINKSICEYILKANLKKYYEEEKYIRENISSFRQKIKNSKSAKEILDYILEESINISKKGKDTGIGKYIKDLLNKIIEEYFGKDIKVEFNNINCPESLLKHIEKWFNKKIKN
ncbi:AAA family ATPase, partial [Brachyspira catarrhinii]